MSISPRLKAFLAQHRIPYQVVHHTPTDTAFNAAKAAHIPAQSMVKGVLLHDDQGYLLAAIAATRSLDLAHLNAVTGRNLDLVTEQELASIFDDCATGAVPAVGEAYGIPTLWDEPLACQPCFYIEAGDHTDLLRMGYYDFMKVMTEDARCALSV